jgi:hypothetical protein
VLHCPLFFTVIKMSDHPVDNTLLIHAGMRPGELIIGHVDGSDTIFLPPTDWAYRFTVVKNAEREEWAISRTKVGSGALEPLLSFTSLAAAEQARKELHRALLEPAPEVAAAHPNKQILMIVGAAILALIIIIFATKPGSTTKNETVNPISAADQTNETGVQQSTYISPTAPPAPLPSSPGQDLLMQITGGAGAPSATQPAPVQTPAPTQAPPATPGEGLLNQIKGQ